MFFVTSSNIIGPIFNFFNINLYKVMQSTKNNINYGVLSEL